MTGLKPRKLIEEVRKYPMLYDHRQDLYRNSEYKKNVWKKIAKNLNFEDEDELKKKWNGIRDSFRRARQKRKTKSEQAATAGSKYRYDGILEFLIPYLAERKGSSNIADEEHDATQLQDTHEIQQQSEVDEPADEIPEKPILLNTSPANQPIKRVSSEKRRKQKITKVQEPSASSQLIAYRNAEKEAQKTTPNSGNSEHPVDAFLNGIAPTLKSLDPILLHGAKWKIFKIVHEYELEQLRATTQQKALPDGIYLPSTKTSPPSTPEHTSLSEDGWYAEEDPIGYRTPPLQ